MRKEVVDLLSTSEIQKRVISLLKALDLVKGGDKYSNIKLSKKAREVIDTDIQISEEFIEDLRNIFPPGHRGNRNDVSSRVERFLRENREFNEADILKAATRWVSDKQEYCGYLHYFLYKKVGGFEQSRCLEYCELVKDEPNGGLSVNSDRLI